MNDYLVIGSGEYGSLPIPAPACLPRPCNLSGRDSVEDRIKESIDFLQTRYPANTGVVKAWIGSMLSMLAAFNAREYGKVIQVYAVAQTLAASARQEMLRQEDLAAFTYVVQNAEYLANEARARVFDIFGKHVRREYVYAGGGLLALLVAGGIWHFARK